jgi:hypothetical protein
MHRHQTGLTFEQVLNDAFPAGLAVGPAPEFRTEVASLGVPTVNLDRALQVVGELEDDELLRRLRFAGVRWHRPGDIGTARDER